MNPVLESAITRFDRLFGWNPVSEWQLSRPAPDADESATAARNTFRLVRAIVGRV